MNLSYLHFLYNICPQFKFSSLTNLKSYQCTKRPRKCSHQKALSSLCGYVMLKRNRVFPVGNCSWRVTYGAKVYKIMRWKCCWTFSALFNEKHEAETRLLGFWAGSWTCWMYQSNMHHSERHSPLPETSKGSLFLTQPNPESMVSQQRTHTGWFPPS